MIVGMGNERMEAMDWEKVTMSGEKKKEPRWWAEFKCPKCGYATTVTDVCRSCQRAMGATGYEERTEVIRKATKDRVGELKFHRRKMTKDSDDYQSAIFWSHQVKLDCERFGEPLPEWLWFGEETE